jgi:hypothetical protein
MADHTRVAGFVLLMAMTACGHGSTRIDDPVAGVPLARQRAVSRLEFGFRWPLSVGVGVLACDEQRTILFRTQGTTYRLTGPTSAIAGLAPYRILEPSGPPTNPLRRIKQDDRMAVFASVMSCAPGDASCSDAPLRRFGLTREEWTQVEAEGRERRWPPLTREPMTLDPLIAAGRPLCDR